MIVSIFDLLFENNLLTEPYSILQFFFRSMHEWVGGGGLGGGAINFLISYIICNVDHIIFFKMHANL